MRYDNQLLISYVNGKCDSIDISLIIHESFTSSIIHAALIDLREIRYLFDVFSVFSAIWLNFQLNIKHRWGGGGGWGGHYTLKVYNFLYC